MPDIMDVTSTAGNGTELELFKYYLINIPQNILFAEEQSILEEGVRHAARVIDQGRVELNGENVGDPYQVAGEYIVSVDLRGVFLTDVSPFRIQKDNNCSSIILIVLSYL